MKKFVFYICPFLLVMVLVFTSGCSCGSNVPVRYPEIELPPSNGQNTMAVIDDIIEIPANELWHKTVEIPDTVENVTVAGWFVASGGARNDIKALLLDDIGFHNWRNFSEVKNQPYQSEKISVDNFTAEINTPGKYHLVFSNWFSEFSTKKVIAKVYLYWSVKPVTYKITADNTILNVEDKVLNADDFKIPASANVTFEYTGGGGLPDFKISQDKKETYINANIINGTKLWFIAPPYKDNNTYEFSYTRIVEGKVMEAQSVKVTYIITANNTVQDAEGKVLNAKDFEIPASANVTFKFTNGWELLDFKVSQDGEEISVPKDITGNKLWFIAPKYNKDNNTYNFSYTWGVKGKIITAAPSIGRGLTVSSSMANAPPRIEKINNYKKDNPRSANITIDAMDPDDDELTYYAFNIPVVLSDSEWKRDEYGKLLPREWHPIATINATSGEFIWNEYAEYLSPNDEYWVHFEVFDGILRDQWDLKIPKQKKD